MSPLEPANLSPVNTLYWNRSFWGRSFYNVQASETPDGKERVRAYYEALGKFVDMFAQAEDAIARTLWHYAQTKSDIAKIIFSGVRANTSAKLAKQLAEATGVDAQTRKKLEHTLQQLGIIGGARDNILHYGATLIAEGRGRVSNALRAKGEPQEFPISPTILNEMTDDLLKIIFRLNYEHLGRPKPRGALGQTRLDELLRAPWQYKHPSQPKAHKAAKVRKPSQKRDQEPPRQP